MKSLPILLTALLALPAVAIPAQTIQLDASSDFHIVDPVQSAAGFPVTGRMVCADTQHAARFAQVTLLPAREDGGRRLSARTDLDGNFLLVNVPAGDYYVTGSLPGYVNQAAAIQSALSAGTDPAAAAPGVPLIHVGAGGASAALSLARGGTLAGAVTWDDGTPAAGVNVSAQPAPAAGAATGTVGTLPPGNRGYAGAQTDDRGRFRLSSLPPGSYYLRAGVQAPAPQRPDDRGFNRTFNLQVYAPDKVRRSDATPIPVTAGEEHADIGIVLGLAGMHTVSGVVSASAAAVRSGGVTLTDQTDSSLTRSGTIASDGSFVVPYVPPGTYTLRVNASAGTQTYGRGGGNTTDATRFGPLQESITVTDADLTGLALTVTPATASASQ